LANDNLSGIAVITYLARWLTQECDPETITNLESQAIDCKPYAAGRKPHNRYSYRFLFAPGTIGAITWLARNEDQVRNIRCGLVVNCAGDSGPFRYKKSRRSDTEIDRLVPRVLKHSTVDYEVIDFSPDGYDERQFCSPGFNLPVGRLTRSCSGEYPEYHTSADDLDLVRPRYLEESFRVLREVVSVLEINRRYLNLEPKGEPQLGKRGLYRAIGGASDRATSESAVRWVLNLSDGGNDLLSISEKSGLPLWLVYIATASLVKAGLLKEPDS
jgi:aminopeptidase-like protein